MTSATESPAPATAQRGADDDPVVEYGPDPGFWRTHGAALGGYAVLTAVMFWPVTAHFGTRILSDGGDGAAYLWNLWSLPHALLGGHNPFDTKDIFFPVGAHTAFNTNMPLVSVLSWPLQKLFGLGVAANVMQLGGVVLSGFGAYLLAHHVTKNRPAAFMAGAAFTFAPYRFLHAAHYDLSHLEFLPFGILALLVLYERPTRKRALAFGAVAGLTFLTNLYYFVFLLIACAVIAAWCWRRTLTRDMAVRLGQAGVVAAVVAAPLLVVMARELMVFHSLDPVRDWAGADNYSANFLSWVTPSSAQRIWGMTFEHVNSRWTGGERLAIAGFTVMELAPIGVFRGGRGKRGLWITLGVVFVLLSFGPFLHVGHRQGGRFVRYGIRYTYWMPYQLLHAIPVVNGVRVPGRFSVVGILALDVLAALGVAWLMARVAVRHPGRALAVPAVALLLVVVEFYPQGLVTQKPGIPRPYSAIARDQGDRAVLEIPLQWRTGFGDFGDTDGDQSIFLYYATRHGKPMVGGMVARYPVGSRTALLGNPLLAEVVALQQGDLASTTFTAAELRSAGIGYVVYHRDRPRPAAEAYLADLHLPVLADDGTVLVWKVP
jgi:hypothetical protein